MERTNCKLAIRIRAEYVSHAQSTISVWWTTRIPAEFATLDFLQWYRVSPQEIHFVSDVLHCQKMLFTWIMNADGCVLKNLFLSTISAN